MAVCCLAGAGQIASWQSIRVGDSHFQWCQEDACLSPALPTASVATIVLFYMDFMAQSNSRIVFFFSSYQNITMQLSLALLLVSVNI